MEKLSSIEKYIEMGKVKVVPVDQAPEQEQPSPVEPVAEQAPEPVAEILAIEPPVIAEAKPAPKKEQANVTCENCGKSMLMKTYKYSHLKLCKPAVPEPPPPPEPKAKAKRVAKPKVEKPTIVQPVFTGEVSFTHVKEPDPPSHIEVYKQAKDQRQQLRVQRVKSLIAQAI
jgi:hypothetical protein